MVVSGRYRKSATIVKNGKSISKRSNSYKKSADCDASKRKSNGYQGLNHPERYPQNCHQGRLAADGVGTALFDDSTA